MLVTAQTFEGWLKSSYNMKLSSDTSVLHLTHEGVTNFASLSNFDKKIIFKNRIPSIDSDVTNNVIAESAVSRASMSFVLVS